MNGFKLSLITVMIALAIASTAPASAASWSAFSYADFHGIDIEEVTLPDGGIVYNLSLMPDATVTIDGIAHQITWLQGFYIRTQDVNGAFSAVDAGLTDWKWAQKPPSEETVNLAGWHGTGANRVYVGQAPKPLSLASLDTMGTPVDFGYHVAYMIDGVENTGFYYGNIMPEPSTLQAGAVFLAGLGGLARWRRRR